jgi:hypothetical protein
VVAGLLDDRDQVRLVVGRLDNRARPLLVDRHDVVMSLSKDAALRVPV